MPHSDQENHERERIAVEAEIRDAFRGVTREHGVSWSEAEVIDRYGGAVERATARAEDQERSWEELVDDPAWDADPGMGGYIFLDPIGFRYYIAPALIRCVRGEFCHSAMWTLKIEDSFSREKISMFSPEQKNAVARAIRFLIAIDEAGDFDWATAYDSYWRDWPTRPPIPRPPPRYLLDQSFFWGPPSDPPFPP